MSTDDRAIRILAAKQLFDAEMRTQQNTPQQRQWKWCLWLNQWEPEIAAWGLLNDVERELRDLGGAEEFLS